MLQQRVAKLCNCETQVTGTFLHALLIWKATSLIQTTVCCKLQHICRIFAAYLQHIYCKWQFLKNHEFSQGETQDIESLQFNYTSCQISRCCRSAVAICCMNQMCCSNFLTFRHTHKHFLITFKHFLNVSQFYFDQFDPFLTFSTKVCQINGPTDRWTNGWTDTPSYRDVRDI